MNVKINYSLNKAKFSLKKHSPEILIGVGIVGVVSSAVMACKATTKLSEITSKHKEDVGTIHDFIEHPEHLPDGESYSKEDAKKDLTITYFQTGLKIVKLYAPSVILGALSIGCLVSSTTILKRRNAALAAAYTTIDKGFKKYRSAVVEKFGEELDKELRYGIKAKEIEKIEKDEEGNDKLVKKTVNVTTINGNEYSQYARFFDCGNTGWEKDPEHNLWFLKQQQNYANEKLKCNGYLFLNDVYDMLGIPRSQAGQVVGWIYDPSNPDIDSYVDFGIYDLYKEVNRDFVNGHERTIILDFNVDGPIYDKMKG